MPAPRAVLRSAAPLADVPATSLAALGASGAALAALLARARAPLVITGAGISTASGVPDYRSPGRPAHNPVRHTDFVTSKAARVRFWARSLLGWPRFAAARPNDAHRVLAALQRAAVVRGVVTQNVDGLHAAAGSSGVIELHGSAHTVRCLSCGWEAPRAGVHAALAAANAGWLAAVAARAAAAEAAAGGTEVAAATAVTLHPLVGAASPPAPPSLLPRAARPDGDSELPPGALDGFAPPSCPVCGGDSVAPTVVFHGGSVPRPVADAAAAAVAAADALLVVGTTLSTASALRLVRAAAARGVPIAIVNHGPTRGDELAAVRVDAHASAVLRAVAADAGVPWGRGAAASGGGAGASGGGSRGTGDATGAA